MSYSSLGRIFEAHISYQEKRHIKDAVIAVGDETFSPRIEVYDCSMDEGVNPGGWSRTRIFSSFYLRSCFHSCCDERNVNF